MAKHEFFKEKGKEFLNYHQKEDIQLPVKFNDYSAAFSKMLVNF